MVSALGLREESTEGLVRRWDPAVGQWSWGGNSIISKHTRKWKKHKFQTGNVKKRCTLVMDVPKLSGTVQVTQSRCKSGCPRPHLPPAHKDINKETQIIVSKLLWTHPTIKRQQHKRIPRVYIGSLYTNYLRNIESRSLEETSKVIQSYHPHITNTSH